MSSPYEKWRSLNNVLSPAMTNPDLILRLFVALLLGCIIGYERESIHSPAGLRTHALVSVGSALFTILSIYMGWWGGDFREPGRIAAQIVTGIGFLGAGTILRHRAGIRGLTTAASLWAMAGIGMAAGAGFYLPAAVTTLFVFLSLRFLKRFERKVPVAKRDRALILNLHDQESIPRLSEIFSSMKVHVYESSAEIKGGKPEIRLNVLLPENFDSTAFMAKLLDLGVTNYEWEDSL